MRALVIVAGGLTALGLFFWLNARPAQALPPSAEAGGDVAARWCAACHVVAASGAGSDAAPSFMDIARRRDAAQLRAFLSQPHAKPMRGFTLSTREIEDMVAYIVSLKDEPAETVPAPSP